MAHLLLILAAAQRSTLAGSSLANACANSRHADPRCSLLFPDDDLEYDFKKPSSEDSGSGAWRKGKLTMGGDYWWRESRYGEPEISLTDPTDEWKVGKTDEGREYFWRERDGEEDDVEVRLARFEGEQPGDADDDAGEGDWRIGKLPSGREYLWRQSNDPDDPDVQWWTQGKLDSGEPFWYDEDGEVTLSDPFERARAYEQ